MGEGGGSRLAAGSDRKEPRLDRGSDLRNGWVVWPKFADPCSAGAARFAGRETSDSPLRRSVAGLKKLKARGWSGL